MPYNKIFSSLLLPFLFIGNAIATTLEGSVRYVIDELTINGHPGYSIAADVSGVVDKVIIIVSGFDIKNEARPEDELDDLGETLQYKLDELSNQGWDVIYFEYVDGSIDLKENADNLAHFIRSLEQYTGTPDYHLALIGGSMGGIVVRTMFVQENSDMGVDTYVSLDAPHHGVIFSDWVDNNIQSVLEEYFKSRPAGLQMYAGHADFESHYGWLRSVETSEDFMETIIDPMATATIALSNGETNWEVNWTDKVIHNKWYGVSSTVYTQGATSTYMPYHSVTMMADISVSRKAKWNRDIYNYNNTGSRYFDSKIMNPVDEHSGPDYAILQAVNFAVSAYSEN